MAYIRFFILFADKLKSICKRLLIGLHFHVQIKLDIKVVDMHPITARGRAVFEGWGNVMGRQPRAWRPIGIGSGLGLVDKD